MVIFMNNKIYNIVVKEYNKFIKPKTPNLDLGTYYNLYDEKFNFIQRFQKQDLPKILTKYGIKYSNLRFQH